MSKKKKDHTIYYRAEDGSIVSVVTPWGAHSGMIPPPFIEFYRGAEGYLRFYYINADMATR